MERWSAVSECDLAHASTQRRWSLGCGMSICTRLVEVIEDHVVVLTRLIHTYGGGGLAPVPDTCGDCSKWMAS